MTHHFFSFHAGAYYDATAAEPQGAASQGGGRRRHLIPFHQVLPGRPLNVFDFASNI